MSYDQRIYEDFSDYPLLKTIFTNADYLKNEISLFLNGSVLPYNTFDLSFITDDATEKEKLGALILTFAYPIYFQYENDRMAYKGTTARVAFTRRMLYIISRKIGKWYLTHEIDKGLLDSPSLEKFIQNGGTKSTTSENASSGSAVIQKSASTPTGITHSTEGESIDMELSHNDTTDKTSLDIDDDYEDKYTNFVGKTNGLHRNEVDRDTDITRSSNYGLAEDILAKIPQSYINEVLTDVSQLFIQVY